MLVDLFNSLNCLVNMSYMKLFLCILIEYHTNLDDHPDLSMKLTECAVL
jgi:hypothetical protein